MSAPMMSGEVPAPMPKKAYLRHRVSQPSHPAGRAGLIQSKTYIRLIATPSSS